MSINKATYFFLIVFIILGMLYYNQSTQFIVTEGDIDAGYFPRILAIALIGLCIISLIQTIKKKETKKLDLSNFHLVISTIGITGLYFLLWNYVGFFYPLTFLFLMSLFILYKPRPIFNKGLAIAAALALSILLLIYIVFDWIMLVQF